MNDFDILKKTIDRLRSERDDLKKELDTYRSYLDKRSTDIRALIYTELQLFSPKIAEELRKEFRTQFHLVIGLLFFTTLLTTVSGFVVMSSLVDSSVKGHIKDQEEQLDKLNKRINKSLFNNRVDLQVLQEKTQTIKTQTQDYQKQAHYLNSKVESLDINASTIEKKLNALIESDPVALGDIVERINNLTQDSNQLITISRSIEEVASSQIKLESGEISVREGNLSKGDGRRRISGEKKFNTNFTSEPVVYIALNDIDSDNDENLRLKVDVTDVNREGFQYVLETWGDTRVYSANASWFAYGK
ncbi:MAG: hypothetical protein F6K65_17760 [Moorea sp. SIO3C2]|nr:hypothetical protein [Moorena sp. SIO3C2]